VPSQLESVELVSDDELRNAMRLMLREVKLAVEPAGAAAMARWSAHCASACVAVASV